MSWFIGSVVLALLAAWAYWELRIAGRSQHDPARDDSTVSLQPFE